MNTPLITLLSHLGLIACSGIDSAKFLQGQLTCDIQTVTVSYSPLGCYCDHKGRVLASFRVFLHEGIYYLSLPLTLVPSTLNELKKFALFSKVILTDISIDFSQIGLMGDATESLLLKRFGSIPRQENETVIIDDYTIIRIANSQIRFLVVSTKAKAQLLWNDFQPFVSSSDENIWNLLDIRQGVARIYPETVGMFTPHDLNFPNLGAVSFTKGCYRGQEIVARMQYLGKLKRHLSHAKVITDTLPIPGMKLQTSEQLIVGEIVTSAEVEKNHYELLVVINEIAKKNGPVFLDGLSVQVRF